MKEKKQIYCIEVTKTFPPCLHVNCLGSIATKVGHTCQIRKKNLKKKYNMIVDTDAEHRETCVIQQVNLLSHLIRDNRKSRKNVGIDIKKSCVHVSQ